MIQTDDASAMARGFQAAAQKAQRRYLQTREKLIAWRFYSLVLAVIVAVQALNYYLDVTALQAVAP